MGIISIEKLDTENFSRFGSVIQKKNASELRSINQGTTTRHHNISELNFKRIYDLRKKFKLSVGYSNHNNNFNTLYVL